MKSHTLILAKALLLAACFAPVAAHAQNFDCEKLDKTDANGERQARMEAAAQAAARANPPDVCLPRYLEEIDNYTDTAQGFPRAAQMLRTALMNGESAWGQDSAKLLPFLSALSARILVNDPSNLAEAEALNRRALAIADKNYMPAPDRPYTEGLFQSIAEDYVTQAGNAGDQCDAGNTAGCAARSAACNYAEVALARGLQAAKQSPRADDRSLINPLGWLADFYNPSYSEVCQSEQRVSESLNLYHQLADIQTKLNGPASRELAGTWLVIARIYSHEGDYRQAEVYDKLALDIARALPETEGAADNQLLSSLLMDLGTLAADQRNPEEAKSYFSQSAQAAEQGRSVDDFAANVTLRNLVEEYADAGMNAEAVALCQRLISVEKGDARLQSEYLLVLSDYAGLLRRMNRPNDAAQAEAEIRSLQKKVSHTAPSAH